MRLSQFSNGSLSHKRGGQISSGSLRQSAEVLAASSGRVLCDYWLGTTDAFWDNPQASGNRRHLNEA